MEAVNHAIESLIGLILHLRALGLALFFLLMVITTITYPFVKAYAAHVEDKEARARFNELAKESDERMRKVRADMAESEARFRKLTGQA